MKPISFRTKAIGLALGVQLIMLALLVSNTEHVTGALLSKRVQSEIDQARPLLDAALGAPLVQSDFVTLQEILRDARRDGNYEYFLLYDRRGKLMVAENWPAEKPVPAIDLTVEDATRDARYDASMTIYLSGQAVGSLRYGVGIQSSLDARRQLLLENIGIAVVAFLVSAMLLTIVGLVLTRRLEALRLASERITAGALDVPVPQEGGDEFGLLGRAMHLMISSLKARLTDLEQAVGLQNRYAGELRGERSRLLALLSAMEFGVLFVDSEQRVVYRNPAFARMWSLADAELSVGKPLSSLIEDRRSATDAAQVLWHQASQGLANYGPGRVVEFSVPGGRNLRQALYSVEDTEGGKPGHLFLYEDVTALREAENQLLFLAERDSLTGLYNRRSFENELNRMIDQSERDQRSVAVLLLDLDEFKSLNDHYGHRMGDQVLVQLADAIRRQLRKSEFFARLGGDEFALVVGDIEEAELRTLAERVVSTVASVQFPIGEQRVTLTGSLGVALYPGHATDAETLVVHADLAMYQAKDAGKNTWCLFNPELKTSQRHRALISWNDRIRKALREDGFLVYCQGVFGASDGRLRYNEALLRLPDPATGKIITPDQFIEHAEKSRLIVEIDRWMIRRCLGLLSTTNDSPPLAINISGRTFDDPDLADYIRTELRAANVDSGRVHFEITETAAIKNIQDAQHFIVEMHKLGCKVCLDDFGAGFSSFTYLRHLPVDIIKIDGGFIHNLARESENQVFVRAMLDVARGFRKQVVAEGLEDHASLLVLQSYGIEMVQGYMMERPRPYAALAANVLPFGPRNVA